MQIFKHPIVKAFSSMTSSAILAQILYLICLPYLSRVYTPSDFGLLASVSTIASLFVIFSVLRIDFLFIKNQNNTTNYFYSALLILLVMSLLSIFILEVIDYPLVIPNWQLFICFLFIGLYSIGTNFSVGTSDYKSLSIGRIIQIILQCLVMMFFAKYYDSYGLIYGFVVGQLVASLYFFYKLDIGRFDFYKILELVKVSKKFCTNNTLLAMLQYSVPLVPILVGKYFYTTAELGGYFLFFQTFAGPFAIIRRSLLNIVNAEFADKLKFSLFFQKMSLSNKTKPIIVIYLLIGVIIVFGLNIFGNEVAALVFGNDWFEFGYLLKWVLLFFLVDIILQPFASLLGLWENYKASYFVEIFRFFSIAIFLPSMVYILKFDFATYIMFHVLTMTFIYLLNVLIIFKYGTKN